MTTECIRAAGGLLWRPAGDGAEVVLVHRDRYDDWTFPKGKLDPGETWEQAAVREVWEETAIVPVLGVEIASVEYLGRKGRPKRVRYWAMRVAADAGFVANAEITDRRWLPLAEAARRLTYEYDRRVLDDLAAAIEADRSGG